ncbi:MAG TPA: hypothetical protein PLD54_02425 [Candidatus Levybacteria bacterium]|nr:hypothetical protein [Candidatus Levybacteria bacterium]
MSKKSIVKQEKTLPKQPKELPIKEVKDAIEKTNPFMEGILLPQRVVMQIADEVAKVVTARMGNSGVPKKKKKTAVKNIENAVFLDTSAIIDGRVFDLMKIGAFYGNFVLLEGVVDELKNIADSRDSVKKDRGRTAMQRIEQAKKERVAKFIVLEDEKPTAPVDDRIIATARKHKGRIITCDFNLSQKAKISNVKSIDLYEMANILKTTAIPGETFFIKLIQKGKGEDQGVGYLEDGTMIVVEQGKSQIGNTVEVEIIRVIQTDAGKIFFGKLKE